MEKNLVLTSTCNDMSFDTLAKALLDQHWDTHNHSRGGNHDGNADRAPRGKGWSKGSTFSYPRAYVAAADEGEYDGDEYYYESECQVDDYFPGDVSHPRTATLPQAETSPKHVTTTTPTTMATTAMATEETAPRRCSFALSSTSAPTRSSWTRSPRTWRRQRPTL